MPRMTVAESLFPDLIDDIDTTYLELIADRTVRSGDSEETGYIFNDGSVIIHDNDNDELSVGYCEYDAENGSIYIIKAP
jgi:hypothetical protein